MFFFRSNKSLTLVDIRLDSSNRRFQRKWIPQPILIYGGPLSDYGHFFTLVIRIDYDIYANKLLSSSKWSCERCRRRSRLHQTCNSLVLRSNCNWYSCGLFQKQPLIWTTWFDGIDNCWGHVKNNSSFGRKIIGDGSVYLGI